MDYTTREDVRQKVYKVVSDQLAVNIEDIMDESNFTEDLNADSLDLVETIMELETAFNLDIKDEEAQKLKTIGKAIDYICDEISVQRVQ